MYINPDSSNWLKISKEILVDTNKNQKIKFISGEKAALKALEKFLENKLLDYAEKRNDPSEDCISDLSPYLHFGQISSRVIEFEVRKFLEEKIDDENYLKYKTSAESFLEELIVRKELSDNFCFYNKNYDSIDGIKPWAKKTLDEHRNDKRESIYNLGEFENAETHDEAWNAAQIQLIETGKIHGYMRMYWCKKILEWTNSSEEAVDYAIYLNDKYSIDGYDPNGYVGILWSIGGLHDRAWTERPVFGKIRFMNFEGLKRKFNIQNYIDKYKKHDK